MDWKYGHRVEITDRVILPALKHERPPTIREMIERAYERQMQMLIFGDCWEEADGGE